MTWFRLSTEPDMVARRGKVNKLSQTSIIEQSEDKTRKQERGKRIRTQLIESVIGVVHLD